LEAVILNQPLEAVILNQPLEAVIPNQPLEAVILSVAKDPCICLCCCLFSSATFAIFLCALCVKAFALALKVEPLCP